MRSNEKGNAVAGGVIVLIVIILGVVTFLTSLRSVDTGRIGVVTSFGKVTGRELSEGVSTVAPWGFNNVTEYDIKTQKQEVTSSAASKDLQDVKGTLVLNFRLERGSVSKIHQEVGKDYQDKVVTPAINEVFKAATAKYTASELITQRAEVKADITEALQGRLKARGILIEDVNITNFEFSVAFNQAIEAVQIANQNIARARQELETTKVEAEKAIAAANGAAEAQRVQQQTLTQEILQKQAIEKWDGKLPTTYAGDAGTLFNIPLR